jgi:hypothetical protein
MRAIEVAPDQAKTSRVERSHISQICGLRGNGSKAATAAAIRGATLAAARLFLKSSF